jgi:hypothetical protein
VAGPCNLSQPRAVVEKASHASGFRVGSRVFAGVDDTLSHVAELDVEILRCVSQDVERVFRVMRSRSMRIPWACPMIPREASAA